MNRTALVSSCLVVALTAAPRTQAPAPSHHPIPVFADADRRATLAAAFDAIRAEIPARAAEIGAPGLVWGVVIDGQLAASGAHGVGDVETGAPATEETVFRIASMSKSFTALAILKLRDEGQLSLDDAVVKHIPEFAGVALPTRDSAPITIRHLLTHGAGFPEDNPWGDRQLAQPDETLSRWLRQGIPFSTGPGTAFEYSNYGFALLGRVVANVSRMPYAEYMNTRILRPLGMTSSYWDVKDVPADRLARGYRREDDTWKAEVPLAHGSFGPMGGLHTSARDLAKYVAYQLSAWPARDEDDRGPVRRASLREMQQGHRASGFGVTRNPPGGPLNARAASYGYGLGASQDCNIRFAVAHGGGLPGYGSNMTWLPDHGVGVLVLANVTYAGAGGVARMMLDKLAATGALQPRHLPAAAPLVAARDAIAGLVNGWTDRAMIELAADNLLLDRPLDSRRTEVARLRESLGACRTAGAISAENWLRGAFRLTCDRGWLDVTFTLAPTAPPKVQYLALREGKPLTEPLAARIASLASLASEFRDEVAAETFASDTAARAFAPVAEAMGAQYGVCRVGPTLAGDGTRSARVQFDCQRGSAVAVVAATPDGRIERVSFQPPPGQVCPP